MKEAGIIAKFKPKYIMSNSLNNFNVVVIGGSGFWSEANHIPNLLAIKNRMPALKVVGICDVQDPYETNVATRVQLRRLLQLDAPAWVSVKHTDEANIDGLAQLHADKHIDLMIIACNPTKHFDYAMWAMSKGVSVVCDKPLIDVANAASDPGAAISIWEKYNELLNAYIAAKRKKPYLSFSLILRRRALPAFNAVAERLQYVSNAYGAGVNHLNILNHNGVYKYPEEMEGTGAHDFSMGVGALSHSSYHYIDLFTRYLSVAKGDVTHIVPRLSSVYRIKDYLDAESYNSLKKINNHSVRKSDKTLPPYVVACELDFAFHIDFLRADGRRVGDGNFISNHTSFSPRTRGVVAGVTEPAQYKDGGRISHLYIDVHQSGLQNLQIIKNDVAFQGPSIMLNSRTHPKVSRLPDHESINFDDAYNKTEYHLKDMLELVVDAIVHKEQVQSDLVIDITEDALNMRLFAKFYELIALDYIKKKPLIDEEHKISLF
jgi:hypothetical protein